MRLQKRPSLCAWCRECGEYNTLSGGINPPSLGGYELPAIAFRWLPTSDAGERFMPEPPAFYGSPRDAVRAAARELSAIAVKLESLSETMPAPCDRAVLEVLVRRAWDCLYFLREAAGRCTE